MFPMFSASSNMTVQNIHNTHLPDTSHLSMAQKLSTPPGTRLLPYQQNIASTSKISQVKYYARAVYPTVIMHLNDIATEQTKATEKTQAATYKLLNYMAAHPDATIRYDVSDMILHS
jgi:hypothetical protein